MPTRCSCPERFDGQGRSLAAAASRAWAGSRGVRMELRDSNRARRAARGRSPSPIRPPTPMNYRRLGRSGLKVSELSFGSWVTYGNQLAADDRARMHGRRLRRRGQLLRQRRGLRQGRVRGDHGRGAQAQLGWRRSSYIVSTKFFWGLNDGPNEKNTLNRKYLRQAIDGSLVAPGPRLRRPRVLPPPRRRTRRSRRPCGAMHDMIAQGKALYWGTSEWSAAEIARGLADRRAPPPAQAGDGAAAVQPAAPRARRARVRAAVRRPRPRHDDLEPARLGPAHRQVQRRHPARTRAARSRATSGSPSGSPIRRSSRRSAASCPSRRTWAARWRRCRSRGASRIRTCPR